MSEPNLIKMYGTKWCGDTLRAKKYFEQNHIPFEFIDIDKDLAAEELVKQINHGYRSVPTIIFPNGNVIVEPTNNELKEIFSTPKSLTQHENPEE
ncbi:MAG: glutaredoxin family protein [Anaerolineaceae bacterium]